MDNSHIKLLAALQEESKVKQAVSKYAGVKQRNDLIKYDRINRVMEMLEVIQRELSLIDRNEHDHELTSAIGFLNQGYGSLDSYLAGVIQANKPMA